jgi:hypothetical protein
MIDLVFPSTFWVSCTTPLTSTRPGWSTRRSPTSATGTAWERAPWHATQRAAWVALTRANRTPGGGRVKAREPLPIRARSTYAISHGPFRIRSRS